jgi:hypothetical protein
MPVRCSALCLVLVTASHTGTHDPHEEEWIQLFNGENLDGWHIKIAGHELGYNFN